MACYRRNGHPCSSARSVRGGCFAKFGALRDSERSDQSNARNKRAGVGGADVESGGDGVGHDKPLLLELPEGDERCWPEVWSRTRYPEWTGRPCHSGRSGPAIHHPEEGPCLLYTSDAA